jgi:hypothetical protein
VSYLVTGHALARKALIAVYQHAPDYQQRLLVHDTFLFSSHGERWTPDRIASKFTTTMATKGLRLGFAQYRQIQPALARKLKVRKDYKDYCLIELFLFVVAVQARYG